MSILVVQQKLKAAGFDPGPLDGVWGAKTEAALDAALGGKEAATDDIDPILVSDLKRDEGFRSQAYPDPISKGDPWTIGYGHTGPEVRKGLTWTQQQADSVLLEDIRKHNDQLSKALPWTDTLDSVRQRVLRNMAFNLGIGNASKGTGLLGFKNTLEYVRTGNYEAAANNMLLSKWAKQVGQRATRLANQMRTGKA